ncbi:hypothetical protein D3C72_337550 [compost metagenome]
MSKTETIILYWAKFTCVVAFVAFAYTLKEVIRLIPLNPSETPGYIATVILVPLFVLAMANIPTFVYYEMQEPYVDERDESEVLMDGAGI